MQLDGQVAIITGAGRGIGREIALAYAREGARLVLSARTASELEETAHEARDIGAEALIVPTDVGDQAQVESMVRQTLEQYSTIDILVNNAGILGPVESLHESDVTEWIRSIQVNVIGTYLCCRAVLPTMIERGRGKIINLSGAGGTNAPKNLSGYGASKAAVVRLSECLSLELADKNIQVNTLGPGATHTGMWEELRDRARAIGDTERYEAGKLITSGGGASIERSAELAVFLASKESGALNGRLIGINDDFSALPSRISDVMSSEAFTLRRVELD